MDINQTDAPCVAIVVMRMVVMTTAEISKTDNMQYSFRMEMIDIPCVAFTVTSF